MHMVSAFMIANPLVVL